VITFGMVGPNACVSSEWNCLHVTLLGAYKFEVAFGVLEYLWAPLVFFILQRVPLDKIAGPYGGSY